MQIIGIERRRTYFASIDPLAVDISADGYGKSCSGIGCSFDTAAHLRYPPSSFSTRNSSSLELIAPDAGFALAAGFNSKTVAPRRTRRQDSFVAVGWQNRALSAVKFTQ